MDHLMGLTQEQYEELRACSEMPEDVQNADVPSAPADEQPAPPAPTLKPELRWNWWLWRVYGWLIHRPWKGLICRLMATERLANGEWGRRYPFMWPLKKWLWNPGKARSLRLKGVRRLLYRNIFGSWDGSGCPWCGTDDYEQTFTQDKYFECIDSGSSETQDGTSYWWKGWQFCHRCGYKEFVSDST